MENTLYFPPKISQRFVNQRAAFLAFKDPREALPISSVIEIVIPNIHHDSIRCELVSRDFYHGHIWANLDSMAREAKFKRSIALRKIAENEGIAAEQRPSAITE